MILICDDACQPSRDSGSTAMAMEESLSFFDDVTKEKWLVAKERVRRVGSNTNEVSVDDRGMSETGLFYQNNYEPNFACAHASRLGGYGEEGKWSVPVPPLACS